MYIYKSQAFYLSYEWHQVLGHKYKRQVYVLVFCTKDSNVLCSLDVMTYIYICEFTRAKWLYLRGSM